VAADTLALHQKGGSFLWCLAPGRWHAAGAASETGGRGGSRGLAERMEWLGLLGEHAQ
jgi:hypothetical protein